MKRGRKTETSATHHARATTRPDRAADTLEAPDGVIIPPAGSLTDYGQMVWDELAPIAIKMGTLKPCDAHGFAIFCVLTAAIHECHRSGAVAPAAQYAEARKQAELYGLSGERSRVIAGLGRTPAKDNPFVNLRRTRPQP